MGLLEENIDCFHPSDTGKRVHRWLDLVFANPKVYVLDCNGWMVSISPP